MPAIHDDARVFDNRCAALLTQRRWDEAVAAGRHATDLKPDWPDAWSNYVAALFRARRVVLAAHDGAAAVEVFAYNDSDRDDSVTRRLRAIVGEDWRDARGTFDAAVADQIRRDHIDAFPYNGTTTTCEAMFMGVPVVALAGRTYASRVGVSLLTAVGMTELIADDGDGYVAIAADLANDARRLSDLRRDLRPRTAASPLMDATSLARAVESACRQAWHAWRRTPPGVA